MTNILMSLEIIKSQLLTPSLPFQMAHGKSIRGLERVSEKALDFTATLCRRLAGAPLDIGSFPVYNSRDKASHCNGTIAATS